MFVITLYSIKFAYQFKVDASSSLKMKNMHPWSTFHNDYSPNASLVMDRRAVYLRNKLNI